MAPDGWCDDGWFYLIEGGEQVRFGATPARPEVIVRALPSMVLVEDDALLFEVGVGKGSLIVSGLNHRRAAGRPENEWLIARLLDHAAAFPQPKAKWPASFLSVVSVAPRAACRAFADWSPTKAKRHVVFVPRRQRPSVRLPTEQAGNRVTWETAPMPKEPRAIA